MKKTYTFTDLDGKRYVYETDRNLKFALVWVDVNGSVQWEVYASADGACSNLAKCLRPVAYVRAMNIITKPQIEEYATQVEATREAVSSWMSNH